MIHSASILKSRVKLLYVVKSSVTERWVTNFFALIFEKLRIIFFFPYRHFIVSIKIFSIIQSV